LDTNQIILKKVNVHNLKNIDLSLPKNNFIVFTGVSGSGKSSLAFDTIYVEGQRRYIESLSSHARRYLGDLVKPDAEEISGISPTIAIEQKTIGKTPRSTVGTMTGIYDYFRILFARIGIPHCPISKEKVSVQSREKITNTILKYPHGSKLIFLSPYAKDKKGEFKEDFSELLRKGFTRVRIDGEINDLNEIEALSPNIAHTIEIIVDRIEVNEKNFSRLKEATQSSLEIGKGFFIVLDLNTNEEKTFSQYAFSQKSGISYGPLNPQDFSFNHPSGMCSKCQGLGIFQEFDLSKIIDEEKSIEDDCCTIASSYNTVRYGNIYRNLANIYKFSLKKPWKKLPQKAKDIFLNGAEKKWIQMQFHHPISKKKWSDYVQWKGILHEAHARFQEAKSDSYKNKIKDLMHESICPDCLGSRLKAYPSATRFHGKTIHEICRMTISELKQFFENINLTHDDLEVGLSLIKEIKNRIDYLINVGVHYLTLERSSPTLSGGESQRIRLAAHIGSGLTGSIYILDEPSIGLHPKDHHRLIDTLHSLKNKGNTLIVVEHDLETIESADLIVDVGPYAGKIGGEILAKGTINDIIQAKNSITGKYLSKELKISTRNKQNKVTTPGIKIIDAEHHNLKKLTVEIPLNGLISITGVSGSGKSSLISGILYPALANLLHKANLPVGKHKVIEGFDLIDKVIFVDQSPIGRTPRSNPGTYIKLFDDIRNFFAELPESKLRGYSPGHFSFNVKEGSCTYCSGLGEVKIDMDFMEDVFIECKQCKGKRFDPEILNVRYKNNSIFDVLNMDVELALKLFENIPYISKKLNLLNQVGLNYIQLGQPSTTLSGGEAQRIKLAKELVRPQTGKTLYILDEPTTGLHFHDIQKLVHIFEDLIELGNTILIIEHNMDLVQLSDWIIDLGPEAGSLGGELIGYATPQKIAKLNTPTGIVLKNALSQLSIVKKPLKFKEAPLNIISIEKASENNLQDVSVSILKNKLTIFTGPSGSGKTSLAFDTIFAEGQRRYIDSLPPFARQIVKQMPKPKVEKITGLLPSIAIEQKKGAVNPRSTIGTITEVYDLLRVFYSHLGIAHCPETNEVIRTISKNYVVDKILALKEKTKIHVLAPITLKSQTFEDFIESLNRQGYLRIRLNGKYYELDDDIPFSNKKKNEICVVIDRLLSQAKIEARLLEAIEKALQFTDSIVIIATEERDLFFNLTFCAEKSGKSYPKITPQTFSFNAENGMCLECQGIGTVFGINFQEHSKLMKLSIKELFKLILKEKADKKNLSLIVKYFLKLEIDPDIPLKKLTSKQLEFLLSDNQFEKEVTLKNNLKLTFKGFQTTLSKAGKIALKPIKEALIVLMHERICPSCANQRLNPLARNVTISDISLPTLCEMNLQKAFEFIENIKLDEQQEKYLKETKRLILKKLSFLIDIGLSYLSLSRSAPSLSGGEMQRIRLAKQLGSGLTNCIYVLDEPTIGLHPQNSDLLMNSLKKLKDLDNTLILVEHDLEIIKQADYIFEFGPKAGIFGGKITAFGEPKDLINNSNSTTGKYLSNQKRITIPKQRRSFSKYLSIQNANMHNLKNLNINIPLELFTCITGVSGSGKSTLMQSILKPALMLALKKRKIKKTVEIDGCKVSNIDYIDKLIVIDQNPIGSTIRSDISTYSDLSTHIRSHYANLPAAKMKGLLPRHFSYNHLKGMCRTCWGLGYKTIDLQFLPSVKTTCNACNGYRLNPISLDVTYKGKHLGNLLQMTVLEAKNFFDTIPQINRKLDTLIDVGLDYVKLGQELFTLSGGEAQRLRLSKELNKRATGNTLYLIDEPTTGLHFEDLTKLLKIFHRLVDKKNSLIIIEHNLDLIANADYIIDLGPNAGDMGGEIVAEGIFNDFIQNYETYTTKYLKKHLQTHNYH
jgi:excinuclease ABC subunit A